MKRILVIGSPGAGKSIFAARLGKVLDLPVIHLDREFWQPGWVETPSDIWRQRVCKLVEPDSWIIDGTYDRTLDIRLQRADTVFFLDYPRYLCLWRIIKRVITSFGRVRFDMAAGCREKLDMSFIRWTWNYRRDHYPRIHDCLREKFSNGNLVVLKNPLRSRRFMDELR
ncbi:MAG TPA: AAA family ATPase [candidate division Zixibacteria bacterium]|nr:AAA family ATPase [candidate division Zixibacteria bacterium]